MQVLKRLSEPALRIATPGFRMGIEDVNFGKYVVEFDGNNTPNLEALHTTLAEARARYDGDVDASDAWLAPRVHAALRLSRRQAADRGIWRYLGLVFAPDFVRWRFGKPDHEGRPEKAPPLSRFTGADTIHALARLWWNAELFRNGKDYSPVAMVFEYQDIPNNFTRAALAHHRPTAQAFLEVIHSQPKGVNRGDAANALAKAANAAATTLAIDVMAPDEPMDAAGRVNWQREGDDYDARAWIDTLPEGPDDGEVPTTSIKTMRELLSELLEEAPLRDRSREKPDASGTS